MSKKLNKLPHHELQELANNELDNYTHDQLKGIILATASTNALTKIIEGT